MNTSKIIKGVVGGGRYTVTAPIIKEDYGLYLQIEGIELPETYEVDFSNDEHSGTSVTVIGNSDGVLIPNQFISSGKDVFAFLYHVGDNYGRTVFKFRIPNKLRPDRTNEEPTPEEQSVIDQAINALNTAVDKTAQDVIDADASAQSASDDADRAEQAKDDAQTFAQRSANSAQASADYSESASQSAQASAQSASQSAQIKTDVEGMVDDAQASADASYQNAQTAERYAQDSATSARQAESYANGASGYESQAQASAETASRKASEASQSAQTASQKATESAQSASQALTYASNAESAKTDAQTAKTQAETARDEAVTAKTDAESARNEAQNLVDGISGKVEQIDANTADIASLEEDRYKPYVTDSASGSIASFPDGADDIPLKSLVVDIDPVQDTSSGDPSPDNICPISGWTGANLRKCNANLLDDAWYSLGNALSLNTDTSSDFYGFYEGSIKSWYENQESLKTLFPNGVDQLTVSAWYGNKSTTNTFIFRVYFYYADGTNDYIGGNISVSTESKLVAVRTSNPSKKCIGFRIYTLAGASNRNGRIKDVMVAVGDARDFVEPVQNPLIPITFGQTVYGGKLDVLSGILTVYPYYASYNGETLTGRWISDRDVYAVGTTPTTGAQVVNIGAQGTEIQLEPHEIASLLGQNNIFADTGDTSVEYRADTKLYIEKLTEPDADMIADANIVSGQYFMVGNNLYKATANIASGSAVIVGTNAIRKSLSEALNEINS